MEVTIHGVTWKVDAEKQTAKARIRHHSIRVDRTKLSYDPDKPFQVWMNGSPASPWVFQFYETANKAAQYISRMSLAELNTCARRVNELDEAAEAAAEEPRIRITGGPYV